MGGEVPHARRLPSERDLGGRPEAGEIGTENLTRRIEPATRQSDVRDHDKCRDGGQHDQKSTHARGVQPLGLSEHRQDGLAGVAHGSLVKGCPSRTDPG